MRGQISVEYMMLIGVILVATIPLFYYGVSQSRHDVRVQQGTDVVNSIATTSDKVFALGLGSRDFVWVNVPTGVIGVDAQDNNLIMDISISDGISQYVGYSKGDLFITPELATQLEGPGNHKVSVETYFDEVDGKVKVLLGGFCGDTICSGVENPGTCSTDCASVCGDGICDYPALESCLGTDGTTYCSDCIDSRADCDSGEICAQDPVNQNNGICIEGAGFCGDGYCYNEPYGENCDNCVLDCTPDQGEQCCPDAVTGTWYRAEDCGIPPTVTSCPDWCKYISNREGLLYNTGTCAQTESKCESFGVPGDWIQIDEQDIWGGGSYSSCGDTPVVDGECDGDEYCRAGPQANHCCCLQI